MSQKQEQKIDDKMHLFTGANLSSPTCIGIFLLCAFVTLGFAQQCRNFHSASDPPHGPRDQRSVNCFFHLSIVSLSVWACSQSSELDWFTKIFVIQWPPFCLWAAAEACVLLSDLRWRPFSMLRPLIMEATVVFIFSGKREKAPASTSLFDAGLSSGGAQSLPFVCMRGRDGAEEKTQLFSDFHLSKISTPSSQRSDLADKYNAGN